jgi:hypothetical protein
LFINLSKAKKTSHNIYTPNVFEMMVQASSSTTASSTTANSVGVPPKTYLQSSGNGDFNNNGGGGGVVCASHLAVVEPGSARSGGNPAAYFQPRNAPIHASLYAPPQQYPFPSAVANSAAVRGHGQGLFLLLVNNLIFGLSKTDERWNIL